jgi:bisphosphoglycerate-independent phosphoglycerate mutase (AlkP superfamily)
LPAQLVVQLALLGDGRQHRGAPVLQLAQITQARLKVAQLGVVQTSGGFLAVTRDKRHRRTFVEQAYRSQYLVGACADFVGDALGDVCGGGDGHGQLESGHV